MPFIATNPATEQIIAEHPVFDDAAIDRALDRAHGAFLKWRGASGAERAACMTRAAELLESEIPVVAELMTSEMGKTFAAAKGEAMKCAATMRYFAEHGESMLRPEDLPTKGSRSGLRYEPIGAIFAVMPWNFPLWQVVRDGGADDYRGQRGGLQTRAERARQCAVSRGPVRAGGLCSGRLDHGLRRRRPSARHHRRSADRGA